MHLRGSVCSIAFAALLTSSALAFEDGQYPDLTGQWVPLRMGVTGQPSFDPLRGWGLEQKAPLTPEYQKRLEASIAEQERGGQGNWPSGARCQTPGMPAMMTLYTDMEAIVLPEVTHLIITHNLDTHRRIFTDGRDWPAQVEPSLLGYSIGKWIDTDGDGRYDTLQVETRHLKGPRGLDPKGVPTHDDNLGIVKERIFLDKNDPKQWLHNEITYFDHAFTHPWTVFKTYRRNAVKYPYWREDNCPAVTANMIIGEELYWLSYDRELMPTRKDQPPPDLKFFKASGK
jgi:hypothetical protein